MTRDNIALVRIRKEIEQKLQSIERVVSEYASIPADTEGWVVLRTRASLLHDFYTGIERICTRIAQELNGGIPQTEQWPHALLQDMTLDLDEIRPPILSEELYRDLLPYLKFRHLFRNLYGFELEWEKMKELDRHFPDISARWFGEIRTFLEWMKSVS